MGLVAEAWGGGPGGGRLNLRELGVPQQGVGTRPKGSKGRPVKGLPVQGPGEISGLLDCPALPSPRVSSSAPPREVGGDHPLRSPTPRPAVPTCSRRFCQRPHGLSSRMSLSSSLSSSRSRSRPRLGAGSGAAMAQPAQAAALRGIRGRRSPPALALALRPGGSGAAGRRLEPPRCAWNWETRRAAGAGKNPPVPPEPPSRAALPSRSFGPKP